MEVLEYGLIQFRLLPEDPIGGTILLSFQTQRHATMRLT